MPTGPVGAIAPNSSRASCDALPFLFKRHLHESFTRHDQTAPAVVQAQVMTGNNMLVMFNSGLAVHPHEFAAQLGGEHAFERGPVRSQLDCHRDTPSGL